MQIQSLRKYLTAAFLLGVLVVPTQAYATSFVNNTGLASPVTTITFSELGLSVNTVVTTQYAGLGVSFGPNLYQDGQTGFPNITGNTLTNFDQTGAAYVFNYSIFFNGPVTSAAFASVSNGSTHTFSAYLAGALVESFSNVVSTGLPNFFGFTGITFDEIRVNTAGDFMILDNLQIGQSAAAVPEPGTLLLLGTGLAAVAVGARRRVKKQI
jgi:hypothetical protein